jgi:hypothetical protein
MTKIFKEVISLKAVLVIATGEHHSQISIENARLIVNKVNTMIAFLTDSTH